MLFNSLQFAIFFPLVTTAYFLLPFKYRWSLLLAASCWFYMAFVPAYILILALTIVVDYFAGLWIEGATGHRRKLYLVMSIVANVGILAVFKYYPFIAENLELLFAKLGHPYDLPPLDDFYTGAARGITAVLRPFGIHWESPPVHLLLPIGLSFHTFQAMSYTIEVYRGHQAAERHFGIYALYVMFYPQLVAGPIERPQNLLHQFHEYHQFDYDRFVTGLQLMLWGFFKKMVIADRLGLIAGRVFDTPGEYHGLQTLVGMYCFAFQIFCDFSGYSDIAIGAARVMGFNLMQNFRRPYHGATIVDFWRRWHISLSTWFRDYVYVPLGGNRGPRWQWYRNTLIVFALSGLWHGAAWTYVVWGLMHGLAVVFFLASSRYYGALWEGIGKVIPFAAWLRKYFGIIVTFHFVLITWVYFRARSMADAQTILTNLFQAEGWRESLRGLASPYELLVGAAAVLALELAHAVEARNTARTGFEHPIVWIPERTWIRWGITYALITTIVLFGEFRDQEFIYFQF